VDVVLTDAQRVLDEGLKLPDEDRSVVALLLLESLGEDNGTIETAWRNEIEERLGDLRARRVDLVPWAEARARIFAR
jgi:putative addiction module component (TIGR02574 family)